MMFTCILLLPNSRSLKTSPANFSLCIYTTFTKSHTTWCISIHKQPSEVTMECYHNRISLSVAPLFFNFIYPNYIHPPPLVGKACSKSHLLWSAIWQGPERDPFLSWHLTFGTLSPQRLDWVWLYWLFTMP